MRVVIDYADQNESFRACLPVAGTVQHGLREAKGPRTWWVIQLDSPLEYQLKVGEPFNFRLITSSQLVIGARVNGQDVGSTAPVPVHILLPLTPEATSGSDLRPEEFYGIAWGNCTRQDAA